MMTLFKAALVYGLVCLQLTAGLHSGALLRMHVIAQDDTAEMQRVKLCVRDAVRSRYAQSAPTGPMYAAAQALLPDLTAAAQEAAAREGFTGEVGVTLESTAFTTRRLGPLTVPAGEYPALVIRLGDARGHNWWGLIDPRLTLFLARAPGEETGESVVWDWSFRAFLRSLLGLPLQGEVAEGA